VVFKLIHEIIIVFLFRIHLLLVLCFSRLDRGFAGFLYLNGFITCFLQLRTPMNILLVNVAFGDFIVAAFGTPLTFLASVLHGWPFGDVMCTVYAFGMAIVGTFSFVTLHTACICWLSLQTHRASRN